LQKKGKIDTKALAAVAKEIGEAMSEAEIAEVIEECGGSGAIPEAQFIECMQEQGLC